LRRAAAGADALGVPLHLALKISDKEGEAQLAALADLIRTDPPNVAAWLIYPEREIFWGGSPVRETLEWSHRALDGVIPGARFGSGTDADYIFMARNLPPLEMVDFLTFAITPQVRFRQPSVVETAAQAAVAHSAQPVGGRPVIVSPITFKMRHNAYASEPPKPTPPGVLPTPWITPDVALRGRLDRLQHRHDRRSRVEAVTCSRPPAGGSDGTASGSSLPGCSVLPGRRLSDVPRLCRRGRLPAASCLLSASNPLAVMACARQGRKVRVLVANIPMRLRTLPWRACRAVSIRISMRQCGAGDAVSEAFEAVPSGGILLGGTVQLACRLRRGST
jgi:hypothetical protein